MPEIVLYAYPFRSRAERVLWALSELGLPHKVIRLDPFKGETLSAEFLALNPCAKVPVLVHGEQVFTESLAIMEYLNDISPAVKLVPLNIPDSYHYRKAVYYAATEIEPYLWISDQSTRLAMLYSWPEGTDASCMRHLEKTLPPVFDWLDSRAYMAGDDFSLADIYYYQLITWAKNYDLPIPAAVEAYLQRLSARPAFPIAMQTP